MEELDLIFGPNSNLNEIYKREPGRVLVAHLEPIFQRMGIPEDQIKLLSTKIANYCRKLYMMHLAGEKTLLWEQEFISTQNREMPVLIWEDEIEMLYHLEAMILFGRSALDIGAYVFTRLLLPPIGQKRIDSFNDFSKNILKSNDEYSELKVALQALENNEESWYRLLCGITKGRSLRDKIAHQTVIHIDYRETRPYSEKEYCHVILGKYQGVPLEKFITDLSSGVMNFCLLSEDVIVKKYS